MTDQPRRNSGRYIIECVTHRGSSSIVATFDDDTSAEIAATAMAERLATVEPRPLFEDGGVNEYVVRFNRGLRRGEVVGVANAKCGWMI